MGMRERIRCANRAVPVWGQMMLWILVDLALALDLRPPSVGWHLWRPAALYCSAAPDLPWRCSHPCWSLPGRRECACVTLHSPYPYDAAGCLYIGASRLFQFVLRGRIFKKVTNFRASSSSAVLLIKKKGWRHEMGDGAPRRSWKRTAKPHSSPTDPRTAVCLLACWLPCVGRGWRREGEERGPFVVD